MATTQQPPATDAELVDALARRRLRLPPLPSQSFTVHDVYIFNSDPSKLYDEYGDGAGTSGFVYFFCDQFTYHDGWKVAAGTEPLMGGGGSGAKVGTKDTLVFHEGRWLPRKRWAMDEFEASYQEGFDYSSRRLRLYRLRRLDG